MGCGASSKAVALENDIDRPASGSLEKSLENKGAPSEVRVTEAAKIDLGLHRQAHERLRKLQELDKQTKVPFILVELTGEGHGEGEIEVCGKDEYGVYAALDAWLVATWGCERLDAGDLTEDTKVPFCSAQYRWKGYSVIGDQGLNNMGLMTMRLIDFVAGTLSWTLAIVNGGNVGVKGEVREQQVMFKAPHPMNLVAPHMMIEIRSAGFIELCADLEEEHKGILDELEKYFIGRFRAKRVSGHDEFCDRYYKAGAGVFKGTSGSIDSNFGLLTTDVCDTVVKIPGWSLIACNGGNYGEAGEHCEQQLVFRRDEHPLGDASYMLVILNEAGNIELNGKEVRDIQKKLDKWLQKKWNCKRAGEFEEGGTLNRRYTWKPMDMLIACKDLVSFFEMQGWEIQVCSQQMINEEGQKCCEQQLLFRPGKTEVGTIEPHLFLELYAGEGTEELYADEEATQVLANQHIRVMPLGIDKCKEIDEALLKLDEFFTDYMTAPKRARNSSHNINTYNCNVFLCRGRFENNLAQWTMRLCDFLVDRLGWSFIVCSLCNKGEYGQFRAQQLVFRWDGDKREVPVSSTDHMNDLNPDLWRHLDFPDHWKMKEVISGEAINKVQCCSEQEIVDLQSMLDSTFKRVLTRDREPDDDAPDTEEMPYRLEVVNAFRSEHAWLHYRYTERRNKLEATMPVAKPFNVKTWAPAPLLSSRLNKGDAYLFHGTNPSSAMSILKTGFALDHAGSSRGTMFGYGIYLAECSSKSDEYGRDDGGNTYPGLRALLLCRSFVGVPYVTEEKGEATNQAIASGFHSVVGDRESKVKTYKEFVFFDEAQVFPEITIIYRRQYDAGRVPEAMRVAAKGTTGRFWQMKADKAWRNVPPEVNKLLIAAVQAGETEVTLKLRGTEYTFDVVGLKGSNNKTQATVGLRAPM